MMQYLGISMVIVVVGLVISLTAGVATRGVLREIEDYKKRRSAETMKQLDQLLKPITKSFKDFLEDSKKKELKRNEKVKKELEELEQTLSKE